MERLNRLIARLRARAAGEEGFTLIEVMVAVAILTIAILALARTATVAFTDVAMARQRQTANQLANQLVEEVSALPWESVTRGLKTNQLTGDPNVVKCGPTWYFPGPDCPPAEGVEKVVDDGNANVRPLVPHRGTVGPPEYPGTYDWSVYVTEAADAPSAGAYRITALVSWSPAQRSGVRSSVDAQTLRYAPEGSVDEATHPFTGPRQAYFFGSANAGAGSMTLSGSIPGMTYDQMSADLLETASTVQTEQTILVSGTTRLPGVSRTVSGVETTAAGLSSTSQADTDPATIPGTYDRPPNVGPQPFGTVAAATTDRVLLGWVDGADQGETTSATAAGGTSACNSQSDGFACGFGSAIQPDGGNECTAAACQADGDSYDTSLMLVSTNWGIAEFLRVGSTTAPTTVYTRRTGSGPSGVVRATTTWEMPEIRIGGVPSGMDPPHARWEGYWVLLTGFKATAVAESGPGAATPTVTFSGKVRYWSSGNKYTDADVTSTGGPINIEPVSKSTVNVGPNGDTVQVNIAGTVSRERTTTVRAVQGGATPATTEARVEVGSPLVAEFTYKIWRNGSPEADLTIAFNAGRARVSTSYRGVSS
jgi:prepilin-type N-terminal cleavage/methylation domain-containing protein